MNELYFAVYALVATMCPTDVYFYCNVYDISQTQYHVRLYRRLPDRQRYDRKVIEIDGVQVIMTLDYRNPKKYNNNGKLDINRL